MQLSMLCKPDNLMPSEHRLTGDVVMGFASNFNYRDHLHTLVSSFLRHIPSATLLLLWRRSPRSGLRIWRRQIPESAL